MRKYWVVFLLIISCSRTQKTIPKIEILFDSNELTKKDDILYFENKLFNGYVIDKNIDGKLLSKSGYLNGKLEGLQHKWFENGNKIEVRFYENNQKNGKQEGWYKNGSKRFEYLVENDIPIGIHQEWYANGQLFSLLTYNDEGQPHGIQKMWFENGKIKVNYVVKNGRRYGFLGAKGCVGEMKY